MNHPTNPDNPPSESIPKALSLRIDRHLFACCATAVGASVMLAPGKAGAAIVYSGVQNLEIPQSAQLYLDFVSSATTGDAWSLAPYDLGFQTAGMIQIQQGYGTTFLVDTSSNVASLAEGTIIDASGTFTSATGGMVDLYMAEHTTTIAGFMFDPASTNGFSTSTPTNYGWVRIMSGTNGTGTTTIIDWAYETVAGQYIGAGATTSVPEPSSVSAIALLALGSAGFLERKRRQKAA